MKSFSVVLSYVKSVVQDATNLCLLQAPQPGSELSLSRQRLRQLGLLPANALLCLLTLGLCDLQRMGVRIPCQYLLVLHTCCRRWYADLTPTTFITLHG